MREALARICEKHGLHEGSGGGLAEGQVEIIIERGAAFPRKDNVFMAATAEARSNLAMLKDHLHARTDVRINDDGQGFVAVLREDGETLKDSEGAPMTVMGYLGTLKAMPEWQAGFKGSGNGGGGTPGDGESAPTGGTTYQQPHKPRK